MIIYSYTQYKSIFFFYLNEVRNEVCKSRQSSASNICICLNIQMLKSHFYWWKINSNPVFLSLKIKVRKISTKDILCFTRIHRPYKDFFSLLGYYNKLILFVYQFIRRVLTERIVKKEILEKYFWNFVWLNYPI